MKYSSLLFYYFLLLAPCALQAGDGPSTTWWRRLLGFACCGTQVEEAALQKQAQELLEKGIDEFDRGHIKSAQAFFESILGFDIHTSAFIRIKAEALMLREYIEYYTHHATLGRFQQASKLLSGISHPTPEDKAKMDALNMLTGGTVNFYRFREYSGKSILSRHHRNFLSIIYLSWATGIVGQPMLKDPEYSEAEEYAKSLLARKYFLSPLEKTEIYLILAALYSTYQQFFPKITHADICDLIRSVAFSQHQFSYGSLFRLAEYHLRNDQPGYAPMNRRQARAFLRLIPPASLKNDEAKQLLERMVVPITNPQQ